MSGKRDLVERLKDLEYSADDVFMASAIQEAIQEIERLRKSTWNLAGRSSEATAQIEDVLRENELLRARIDAAMAWLKSDEEHDDEFELLRILSGEELS